MAGRPEKDFDKEGFIADYKTGRYKGRQGVDKLSKKYSIGKSKAYELIKGVDTSKNGQITDKLVENNRLLNELSDIEFLACVSHAEREVRLKDRRDRVIAMAFNSIEHKFREHEELTALDIKNLVESTDKICVTAEIAPRFSNGITVNNSAQAAVVNPISDLMNSVVGTTLKPA